MEALSVVVHEEPETDDGHCKVAETVVSKALPPKVQIEYFPPHARPYGFRVLPMIQQFVNNKCRLLSFVSDNLEYL